MPRDVSTRWNSTYDMLEFAVEYREALDSITGNQRMKLRQYELSEEDWEIATKLRDVLKVGFSFLFFPFNILTDFICKDFQRCDSILLARYSYDCDGDSSYGSH
jgi:hypothetical protein